MFVSDTGPIVIFARIGRLPLLQQIVETLIIPDAVYNEIVHARHASEHDAGVATVVAGTWIQRRPLTNPLPLTELPAALHVGERHAILLAEELGVTLLIDERRGRRCAMERDIPVVGSLWVFAEAKQRGHIERVQPLVAELQHAGYWLDPTLVRPFLEALRE